MIYLRIAIVCSLFLATLVPPGATIVPGGPSGSSVDPIVPCPDPRGCPDLTVDVAQMEAGYPTRRTFSSTSCAVIEGSAQVGTRDLWLFSSTINNMGKGDMSLGQPPNNPEWFEWSPCHGHYHFIDFTAYRLWTVDGFLVWDELRRSEPWKPASQVFAEHPELASEVRSGHKQGVCPGDIYPATPGTGGIPAAAPSPLPQYTWCWPIGFGPNEAGIARGWADLYNAGIDGQWVDITGIPDGTLMILEDEVNPEHLVEEMDYANNRAFIPLVVVKA